MSFSTELKEEISKSEKLSNKENVKYELMGYLMSSNISEEKNKIKFSTENEYNINRFARLLSNCGIETYNINIQGKLFVITCPKMEIQIDNLTIEQLKNIVRGAYLGSGSINNPENTYHLEISVRKKDYADIIVEGLSSFDIKSNVIDEPILFLASSFLPSPSLKLRFAAAPLPTKHANALHIITIGNITFVAAFPIIPTPLPINI